jgi:hypothetical protein
MARLGMLVKPEVPKLRMAEAADFGLIQTREVGIDRL